MAEGTAHGWRCLVDLLKSLRHHLDAVTGISQVGHSICTLGIMQLFHSFLESLFTLVVNFNQGRLLVNNWGRLDSLDWFLIRGSWFRNGILLTLLGSSCWLLSRWWGTTGTSGCAWIIVYALHVVIKIPATRETIASNAALAPVILAKEGLISMSVHGVGFSLVAQ